MGGMIERFIWISARVSNGLLWTG